MINIIDTDIAAHCTHNSENWDVLFDHYGIEPSTSREWTISLLNNHINATDKLRIIEISNNKDVQAIIPIVYRKNRILGMTITHVFPISELYNTHSGILAIALTPDLIANIMSALSQRGYRWHVFSLSRVIEDRELDAALNACLSNVRTKSLIRYSPPSFYIHLPKTIDEYLSNRSGKFRNYLKRTEKKLRMIGNVEVQYYSSDRDFETYYSQILEIEKHSWKHSHGTAISSIKRQTDFYRDMCLGAAQKGNAHISILFLNKEPIAYNMGYIHKGTYFYLKTSFVEAYRKHGAATILRYYLIENLIESGCEYMDFPGEPYAWETQWTSDLNWHKTYNMFNGDLVSRLIYLLYHIKTRLAKKPQRELQFVNPKDLVA